MADPTLIIQMQRMGDLVMTFPLMAWLQKMEPQRPLWVLAEPRFYKALMPFAPNSVFFDAREAHALGKTRFHRIINLSIRPEAGLLAGQAEAAIHTGTAVTPEGTFISGQWQLYRASIVHNNRHNRMHWSDLSALDTVPASYFPSTFWPVPQPFSGNKKIGLFVGASETAKRPGAAFWAELAKELIRRGMFPVILGGEQDRKLAAEVARQAGIRHADLSGRFTLTRFAEFIRELDLFITPDTGPMHVAAWVQVPTLNLSMGPVNPWETAPAPPGHYVLRAEPSCTGCWECTRQGNSAAPPCHDAFSAVRVSSLVHTILQGGTQGLRVPGLHLMRTARDPRGLFTLSTIDDSPVRLRDLHADLWREFFLCLHGHPQADMHKPIRALLDCDPRVVELLLTHALRLLRASAKPEGIPGPFWMAFAPIIRPLSGYVQLVLENGGMSGQAAHSARRSIALLIESLQKVVS